MKQIRVKKEVRKPKPDLDLRTPSGKELPY
jgi:hypothetical protein